MTALHGNDADFRLPRTCLPRRYELEVAPDIAAQAFTGRVRIEVSVSETLDEIVCNAAELEISDGRLAPAGGGEPGVVLSILAEPETERVRFRAPSPLQPGDYVLECDFSGVLNDKLRGFYRSRFVDPDGNEQTLAATHFESHDARRAFPCFDEPDMKAVFSVTLVTDERLFAVSNGPQLSSEPIGGGRVRVRFADTIVMSTYLVCFVVGPLQATEPVDAGGVPIRVVTPIGKQHLTGFALEVASHALGFFTEYFGIEYPAEKLDLVDVPDFAQGAMENLGCVTFRESDLLCDPDTSSIPELSRIAEVIEHEIAHMWFGDLVTMRWWNGIWLNEAFATFMSICCLDEFRPEWRRWVSFGREKDIALGTDALHSTRAIEFPVRDPEEAEAMFDVLTYLKGGNVLRMLEQYLGPDRLRDGVRQYLVEHRFGNTETTDLWDAIEAVAGGEPVRALMDSWIFQGGFPLVTARREGSEIVLSSSSFSYLPLEEYDPLTPTPSAIGRGWIVPVRLSVREPGIVPDADGGPSPIRSMLLGPPPSAAEALRLEVGGGLPVVNAGGSGTYRLRYAGPLLDEISSGLDQLTALERFNLVSDTWACTLARVSPLDDFLSIAKRLRGEPDPNVWTVVLGALGLLELAVATEDRQRLAQFTRSLIGPELERIGLEEQPGEVPEVPRARAAFVAILGTIGEDEAVRSWARQQFEADRADARPLPAGTAESILQIVARTAGPAEFDALVERVRAPLDPLDLQRHLTALTALRAPALVDEFREMCRVGPVRTQDGPYLIRFLLQNPASGPSTWAWVKDNWDDLRERFPAHAMPVITGGVPRLADVDAEGRPVHAGDVRAFLASHPLRGQQRLVEQHVERLAVNVGFVREHRASLGELLAKA